MTDRRLPPLGLLLIAILFLLVGPQGVRGRLVASASDQVAARLARTRMRSANPNAVPGFALVTITPDSLAEMMQEDLAGNQAFVSRLRAKAGDGAAQALEKAISAPYLRRIDAMKTSGVDQEDLTIPVVTIWGALTFSTRSYDPSLGPMDPVSVLFVGDASPDRVYTDMAAPTTCDTQETCVRPDFQDDKGLDLQSGAYQCQSSTQWVLMGNAGETLRWRPSVRALMRAADKCSAGQRDHMRIYGSKPNPIFGAWSIATPHQEQWMSGPNRFGHVVQSWNDARDFFTGFWLRGAEAKSAERAAGVAYSGSLNWGNGGVYQNVPFDGQGIAIELCSCS